jgi:hypothetical protein
MSDVPEQTAVAEEQLALFGDGAELLTVEEDARRGLYSGKIIEKNRAKVRAICQALAEGIGVNRIAKAFGVNIRTVMGIRDRHPELIAAEEKLLSQQIGRVLKVGVDRYLEALLDGAIPAAQIPVGMGILFDKKALLDGKPTAIVEHRQADLTVERLNELIEQLPGAVVELEASADPAPGAVGPERQLSDAESEGEVRNGQ